MRPAPLALIPLLACAACARREAPPADPRLPCVVMVHGLGRGAGCFDRAEVFFRGHGYDVVRVDYPSRAAGCDELAARHVAPAIAAAAAAHPEVHLLTHSLGGILARIALAASRPANLGAVVQLGPPSRGSEVVDALAGWFPPAQGIMGPAFIELGTGPLNRWSSLPPPDYDLGVIAGDRSINWINSLLIPGPDDGKVSVARTHVDGERDHRTVHVAHPFLMTDRGCLELALRFVRERRFRPGVTAPAAAPPAPP